MPLPLAAIGAGVGIASGLKSLFRGGGGGGRRGYHRKPFEFDFDENDPELNYLRRSILHEGQQTHRRTLDELSRAGLLGSGKAFDVLGDADLDTERLLEGAAGSIYGSRRAEAHQDYMGDVNYGRGLENQGYGERQDALGGIGHLGGQFLMDYWRKRMLREGGGGGNDDRYFIGPEVPWERPR